MEKYLPALIKSPLFTDVNPQDIIGMLGCLLIKTRHFTKNEYIMMDSQTIMDVGIILSGRAHIIREDYWGNRNILATLQVGEMFGETFACVKDQPSLFSVVATGNCEVMFLNYQKITSACHHACSYHTRIIQNMLSLIAQKNIMLTTKIQHITQKNTREKLLSYLSDEARKQHSNSFLIPFNRQELADFLSVERSAMSAELSRMQRDGIISYNKNHFELK